MSRGFARKWAIMYNLSLFKYHGVDVRIADDVEIRRPHLISMYDHILIDKGFFITTQFIAGSGIHIAPYVTVIGGAEALFIMGNFTTIAAGSRIVCASDEYLGEGLISPVIPAKYRDTVITLPVVMRDYSALGTNVVVMPGVVIGEGAVVGANSFVTHDIPAWEIWAGSPARKLRDRPKGNMLDYGEKLLGEWANEP